MDLRSLSSVTWLLLLVLVSSWLSAQEGSKSSSSGASIFKTKCSLCHGGDGSGNTPLGKQLQAANLRSKDVQKKSDADMRKIVHDGQANMPGFSDQLSGEEITQVVRYIRALGKTAKK